MTPKRKMDFVYYITVLGILISCGIDSHICAKSITQTTTERAYILLHPIKQTAAYTAKNLTAKLFSLRTVVTFLVFDTKRPRIRETTKWTYIDCCFRIKGNRQKFLWWCGAFFHAQTIGWTNKVIRLVRMLYSLCSHCSYEWKGWFIPNKCWKIPVGE